MPARAREAYHAALQHRPVPSFLTIGWRPRHRTGVSMKSRGLLCPSSPTAPSPQDQRQRTCRKRKRPLTVVRQRRGLHIALCSDSTGSMTPQNRVAKIKLGERRTPSAQAARRWLPNGSPRFLACSIQKEGARRMWAGGGHRTRLSNRQPQRKKPRTCGDHIGRPYFHRFILDWGGAYAGHGMDTTKSGSFSCSGDHLGEGELRSGSGAVATRGSQGTQRPRDRSLSRR